MSRNTSFSNGDDRLVEAVDLGYRVGATDEQPPTGERLDQWHKDVKATIGAELRVLRKGGKTYVNCEPTDYMQEGEYDPVDWPLLVTGIINVTGWTLTRFEQELDLGHGAGSGYSRGRWKPTNPAIRQRIQDMARACGVQEAA